MSSDQILRAPLNIGVLVTLGGVAVAGMSLAWHGAEQIATMRAELTHQREAGDAGLKAAREQRERVERDSIARHQSQQADIDRLRLEHAATAAFATEAKVRLEGVASSVARIEARLFGAEPTGRR